MDRRLFLGAAFAALAPVGSAFASRDFSQSDASTGLKQALTLAAQTATQRLGAHDGFFGDDRVRGLGQISRLPDLIRQRAAESRAPHAQAVPA